jgi:long-chain acyl-CoA synthetase
MLKRLGEISAQAARSFGDKTALIVGERRFTFTEIDQLASQLANGLTANGVGPGDRVTLYSGNCWEWLVSYYGVAKTGAVVNPINVMLTREEIGFVANDCSAKAILASSDKAEALMDIRASTPLESVIVFGGDAPTGAVSFDELLANAKSRFAAPAGNNDQLSTICYTSGTTGHPKGAMLSHTAVIMNAALTGVMHRRVAEDTVVSALPCAHVYGNVVMNGCFLIRNDPGFTAAL